MQMDNILIYRAMRHLFYRNQIYGTEWPVRIDWYSAWI